MNVLITNDDGVFSLGLNALVSQIKKIAKVTVIAPDRERSAAGHSLTFFTPLRAQKIREERKLKVYSSDGTPSDCILLGICDIMKEKPDIVISGINRGGNLGYDLTYSGTVSAAMEGLIHKIPSFAISLAGFENDVDYTFSAVFAHKLAKFIYNKGLPRGIFLNVNVPNVDAKEIKGIQITFQGKSIYNQKLMKRKDPRGIEYYWISGDYPSGMLEEGSDFKAIYDKKISITPIHLTMTDFSIFGDDRLKDIMKLF